MISGRPDDFKSRVDAIFGALDTTDEAEPSSKGWSLSEKQVRSVEYQPNKELDAIRNFEVYLKSSLPLS